MQTRLSLEQEDLEPSISLSELFPPDIDHKDGGVNDQHQSTKYAKNSHCSVQGNPGNNAKGNPKGDDVFKAIEVLCYLVSITITKDPM